LSHRIYYEAQKNGYYKYKFHFFHMLII